MSRTLGEVKGDVLEGLGRDDAVAVNLFKVAFNAAVEATASFFDPPEMRSCRLYCCIKSNRGDSFFF